MSASAFQRLRVENCESLASLSSIATPDPGSIVADKASELAVCLECEELQRPVLTKAE